MKYRRKPVVVEAVLWRKPGDHAAVVHPVPAGVLISPELVAARNVSAASLGAIATLEGWMLVAPGDYIVRGVHGEHYACKPDIFAETYQQVET